MLLNIQKLQKKSAKTKKHLKEGMSELLRYYAEKVTKNELHEDLLDSLQLIVLENLELIKETKFEVYPFQEVL